MLSKRLITPAAPERHIREENAAAALEVMSRFAANPKWLIYLPPTMSPSETTKRDGLLEHPAEAFSYYRASGVPKVVVEQKHMGSRAILIVCRSKDVARERFEPRSEGAATRGRAGGFSRTWYWNASLATVQGALERSGFWDQFKTTGCARPEPCPGRRRH
jgi:protein phosphatase